jgi:hypothetical protein
MIVGLIRSPVGIDWAELADQTVLLWLAGVTIYQIAFTLWEIWEQKRGDSDVRKVKVAVGMRGLGLFLFMFLLVFVTDGFEQTGPGVTRAMVAVNSLIVLWGFGTMLGPLLLIRETRWLKNYMRDRETDRGSSR